MEKSCFFCSAVSTATGCARACRSTAGPNEHGLFIMTDDHTAQMMSCYDTRYASTPNLNHIAVEACIFTNSFQITNSLSGPSRACMLTGKHLPAKTVK